METELPARVGSDYEPQMLGEGEVTTSLGAGPGFLKPLLSSGDFWDSRLQLPSHTQEHWAFLQCGETPPWGPCCDLGLAGICARPCPCRTGTN